MIHVTIDEDTALEMLSERVEFWNDDPDVVDLFTEYYSECIDNGVFEGADFNVKYIVDNDYVNYTCYGTMEDIKNNYGEYFDKDNILAEHNGLVLYYACS